MAIFTRARSPRRCSPSRWAPTRASSRHTSKAISTPCHTRTKSRRICRLRRTSWPRAPPSCTRGATWSPTGSAARVFRNPPGRLRPMALDPTDSVALNHQALTSLPETLAGRVELRQLHLWGNALTCLPAWLWDLHRLEQLVLADNQLRSLSPKIAHLQRLQLLDLGHNALVAVPEELGSLTGLTGYLYLHDNQR